jgi:putative ABC transport system permease protein
MAKLQVQESFTMALVSLRSNKLRTFLTLLGIIIGVLTIIAVVSVIQGLNNYVYTKMSFYGANDFSVQKFSMIGTSLKDFREQMKRKDITLAERDLIRANCPACELVGASVETSATVKYGSQSLKETDVRGVTEKVFGSLDPLGRWLKAGNENFQVIGVGKKKGKILGFSQDNYIRIPITTFSKVYGSRRSISINIHTNSQEEMARAQEQVRTVLRSWRKRGYNDPDDFSFATSETFIQFYKTATSGIYFAMIAVSSIALVVGGIVIMNIMFVSVSERRKEIGIRMAVGARRRDILYQFLIESALISGLGGFIGIVLGFLVARIISAATSMPSSVEPASIVLAMVMSWSIGLFFGIYPANRAAKLDPVEALRAEQ